MAFPVHVPDMWKSVVQWKLEQNFIQIMVVMCNKYQSTASTQKKKKKQLMEKCFYVIL